MFWLWSTTLCCCTNDFILEKCKLFFFFFFFFYCLYMNELSTKKTRLYFFFLKKSGANLVNLFSNKDCRRLQFVNCVLKQLQLWCAQHCLVFWIIFLSFFSIICYLIIFFWSKFDFGQLFFESGKTTRWTDSICWRTFWRTFKRSSIG